MSNIAWGLFLVVIGIVPAILGSGGREKIGFGGLTVIGGGGSGLIIVSLHPRYFSDLLEKKPKKDSTVILPTRFVFFFSRSTGLVTGCH